MATRGPEPRAGATPLAQELVRQIRDHGPLTVDRYMAACLTHPRFGYYQTREPFGRDGDFITAPEVSQMFGELIGAFVVASWEAMGAPATVALVELGPGRGTLMADLLRAAGLRPAFLRAARVHLVEASDRLRRIQAETLAKSGVAPTWHTTLASLPPEPALFVANEFFDALPIRQFLATEAAWAERAIDVGDDSSLRFTALATSAERPTLAAAEPGAIAEASPLGQAVASELGRRLAARRGVALIVDYGYRGPALGDTLQAIHLGRPDHPLAHPGEADLTAHVDFSALSAAAAAAGARPHTLLTQAELLLGLGLRERAERLAAGKDDAAKRAIRAAQERLAGERAMGTHFKALCLSSGDFAVPLFA